MRRLFAFYLLVFLISVTAACLCQMLTPGMYHHYLGNRRGTFIVRDNFESYSTGILGEIQIPDGTSISNGIGWSSNAVLSYWGYQYLFVVQDDFETNSVGVVYSADMTNGTGWIGAGVLNDYSP